MAKLYTADQGGALQSEVGDFYMSFSMEIAKEARGLRAASAVQMW